MFDKSIYKPLISRINRWFEAIPVGFILNLRWQYVANLSIGLLGGLYILMLGRFYAPSDFGLYSVCLAIATIIFSFADFRLQEATIKFVDLEVTDMVKVVPYAEALLTLDFVAKILVVLAGTTTVVYFWQILPNDETALAIFLLCMANLVAGKLGNSVAVGLIRAAERFNIHAQMLTAEWSARLLLTAIAVFIFEASLVVSLIISVLVSLFSNAFMLHLAVKYSSTKIEWLVLRDRTRLTSLLKKMRPFVLPSYGISFLENMAKEADVAVVALFLPLPLVGIYKMSKSLALMLWKAADPFFLVIMPVLVRFVRNGDRRGLIAFLNRFTVILAVAAVTLVGTASVFMPYVVDFFLGSEYTSIMTIFPIMTSWIVFSLPLIWVHAYAAAIGRPALQLIGSAVGNGIMLLLLFTLTPLLGLTGASMAWSAGLAATFVSGLAVLLQQKAFRREIFGIDDAREHHS